MQELLGASGSRLRRCWKRLFLTGICYQLISFILLTPLVSILFRIFVVASGKTLLADQDILFFFIAPLGWVCLLTVGALWLGIVALQLAAMMAIVADPTPLGMHTLAALRFATVKAWPTIQITARVAVYASLAAAPFLAVAAVVYFTLLGEFDINFYLTNKPPVFYVALGIGAVVAVTLMAVLLRLFTGWAFALPLVLFETVSPANQRKQLRDVHPVLGTMQRNWTLTTKKLIHHGIRNGRYISRGKWTTTGGYLSLHTSSNPTECREVLKTYDNTLQIGRTGALHCLSLGKLARRRRN